MNLILNFLIKILSFRKKTIDINNQTKSDIARFSQELIKPHLKTLIIAMIFMAIFAISNAGLAWMIKPLMNQVFVVKTFMNISEMGIAIITITIVKAISQYLYAYLLANISYSVMATVKNNLYNKFIDSDIPFFNKNNPGSLTSAISFETNAINTLASEVPITLGRDAVTFISLIVVMFLQAPIYGLFVVAIMLFVIIPSRLVKKKVKKAFENSNAGYATYTSQLEQTFNGIREIKSYVTEDSEKSRAIKTMTTINNTMLQVRRATALLPAITEFLSGLSVSAILVYGGYMSIYHGANPGEFFSFIAAMLMAYQPFKRMTDITVQLQLGLMGLSKYYKHLDRKNDIKDSKDAKDIIIKTPSIDFKNLSFYYNKDTIVLNNINMNIKPGQKVALVGESGGGKSTITSLLLRFYDYQKGEIIIDNHNIRDFTLSSLRKNIGLVNQEVVLFDNTIRYNITYGSPTATEEQVLEAAKKAHCLNFIDNLPNGLDTEIGNRGSKLSGGQKQRISIARAILKNAPILLLDEATSALDTESEQKVQLALDALMHNKTSIVIAHRLSTIVNSDVIFVLDKGKIVEHGKHEDLIKNNGLYASLCRLQFNKQ